MSTNLLPLLGDARAFSAALRREICAAGLTQHEAGALVGTDAREVRRLLAGHVSVRGVRLLLVLRERNAPALEAA